LQIRVTLARQHVVEQDPFLQRGQRIDVLNIADAARHLIDHLIDVLLRKINQWQQLRRDSGRLGGNLVRRNHHLKGVGQAFAVAQRGHHRCLVLTKRTFNLTGKRTLGCRDNQILVIQRDRDFCLFQSQQ
jgi:hypothetical protein